MPGWCASAPSSWRATVCPDLQDPFRVADLSAATLAADPARLADEAAQISLMGGRRVVRVRDAGDALAPLFGRFLADMPRRRAGRRRGRRPAGPLGVAPRLRGGAARRRDRLLPRQCRATSPAVIRETFAAHRVIAISRDAGAISRRASRRRPPADPRRTREADALCRRGRPDRARRCAARRSATAPRCRSTTR